MARLQLIAATAVLMTAPIHAQTVPAPPPPVTGCSHCALPPGMGPQDVASNPNSLERMREAIQKDQMDRNAAVARAQLGRSRPAKAADVIAGKPVNDSTGQLMGLIEKVEADGAVVYNGAATVKIPVEAFGMNRKGLLLDLTKSEFDRLVASAKPSPGLQGNVTRP